MRDHTLDQTRLSNNRFTHVVAFEVSKATLLVEARPGGERREIANTPQQVRRLIRREMKRNRHGQLGPMLVVCEATGGYECHVLAGATELGLACHWAHGTRVRYFARFHGRDAKSDGLDVGVLAAYGLATDGLRLYAPPRSEEAALRDLKTRRRELQDMLTAEGNRLEHERVKAVAASAKAVIRVLTRELEKIDAEIAALLARDEEFRFKAGVLQQTIGVAAGVASTLLAFLPEIGTLAKTTVARLAGLAPLDNDSGASRKAPWIRPLTADTVDDGWGLGKKSILWLGGITRRPAGLARGLLPAVRVVVGELRAALRVHDAEAVAGRRFHHDPAPHEANALGAQLFQARGFGLEVVALDVEVHAARVIDALEDHHRLGRVGLQIAVGVEAFVRRIHRAPEDLRPEPRRGVDAGVLAVDHESGEAAVVHACFLRWTERMSTAAGVTPLMRAAWASESGLSFSCFCTTSVERPARPR
jgi:transposase